MSKTDAECLVEEILAEHLQWKPIYQWFSNRFATAQCNSNAKTSKWYRPASPKVRYSEGPLFRRSDVYGGITVFASWIV